jgi:patatin-like phospholipase/acyl hydrolase
MTILQKVMNKILSSEEVRPHDVFDMIAGTSTGGCVRYVLLG